MLNKGSFLYVLLTPASNMILMQFNHLVFPRLLPPAKVQSLLLQYPQPDTEKSDFCLNNRQTQAHLTYDSFLLLCRQFSFRKPTLHIEFNLAFWPGSQWNSLLLSWSPLLLSILLPPSPHPTNTLTMTSSITCSQSRTYTEHLIAGSLTRISFRMIIPFNSFVYHSLGLPRWLRW